MDNPPCQSDPDRFRFEQIHIDVARNATDDFNPFHDPCKWDKIRGNPFGMPIALGFQLEMLLAHVVRRQRIARGEMDLLDRHGLGFVNFQVSFADVVRPGEPFWPEIRRSSDKIAESGQLFNRIALRKETGLVLMGHQRDARVPLFLGDEDLSGLSDLEAVDDRTRIEGGRFFLKRKFMNVSNAKNFVCGSLVDQHLYFDELERRARFPAFFPVSLISCAILEMEHDAGYDFEARPVVYTAHSVSVDRRLLDRLKSNDRLDILVEGPLEVPPQKGLGKVDLRQTAYRCYGLVEGGGVMYRVEATMAPLQEIARRV